jgi:hypothetical protein
VSLRYGDLIRHPSYIGHWTGMILSRASGATGVLGEPIWTLLVIDDDEEFWHPGEIKTVRENEILFYRLTPPDEGA